MRLLLLVLCISFAYSGTDKIKALTTLKGVKKVQLIGYGMVIGLNGTGDSKKSIFTMQSVGSMIERMGVSVSKKDIQVKNVASVIVTATISPFQTPGTHIDVKVSSLSDAKSLEGGTLLVTPLSDIYGKVYAIAQGSMSVGGFSVETSGGGGVKKNYTLVGRVPNGGIIQNRYDVKMIEKDKVTYYLNNPDFQVALSISNQINSKLGENLASVKDPGTVVLRLNEAMKSDRNVLLPIMNEIGNIEIAVETIPKIIVNERTGTIVIGQNVEIGEVAISHGNLSIEISSSIGVSQPNGFGGGETTVVNQTSAQVQTDPAHLLHLQKGTTIQDISKGLNQLGVTPRDLIAIFQALKEAGALKAELVVM